MDEILLEGVGSEFLGETSTNWLNEWDHHLATVESKGITHHVIPVGSYSMAIHETAVSVLGRFFNSHELLPIKLSLDSKTGKQVCRA